MLVAFAAFLVQLVFAPMRQRVCAAVCPPSYDCVEEMQGKANKELIEVAFRDDDTLKKRVFDAIGTLYHNSYFVLVG